MTAFVVVGAGLTGAATAWQLARRGHEVTVLERSAPANAEGSSHGSARILRYGYPDPFYARLVVEARAEWDELERLGGERLITPTGSLDFGAGRDPAALAAVFEDAGVEHELLTTAGAAARWPRFRFADDGARRAVAPGRRGDRRRDRGRGHAAAGPGRRRPRRDGLAGGLGRAGGRRPSRAEHGRAYRGGRAVVVTAGGWLPDLLGGSPCRRTSWPRSRRSG